jgi:hypothetical protein
MRLIPLTGTILAVVFTVCACSNQPGTASAATTPTPKTTTVPGIPGTSNVPDIPGLSSTPGIPGATPTFDVALRAAVQSYSDAYLTGDADSAYGYLSPRCQTLLGHDAFTTHVQTTASRYGDPLPFKTYKASEFGDAAYVSYTYMAAPEINETAQLWSRLDGSWHYDNC